MLKKKIAVCVVLFLLLIAAGAFLQVRTEQIRFHYHMRLPVPDGSYRIYNSFEKNGRGLIHSPYLPREYVRIVDTVRKDLAE